MLKNYIDEEYLKGIQPDLDDYKRITENDFSRFFSQANNELFQDLIKKNLSLNKLMPELSLRSSGTVISSAGVETGDSVEDTLNRLRLVWNVTTFTGLTSKILTLKGSNDDITFTTVEEIEITETGIDSIRFENAYVYYKVEVTTLDGTIDLSVSLIETTYDNLFAYKILELIMRNCKKEVNDSMHLKEVDYMKKYQDAIQTTTFYESTTDENTASGFKETKYNTITMLK